MNNGCPEGLSLRLHFERTLKEWGWFDAYERALELLPVGHSQVHEFQTEARHAQTELTAARNFYVEHMSRCLVCSRRLVAPDALLAVREKLHNSRLN